MKTLKYTNANKAIDVEYLTDLIGSNEEFTTYQVKQIVDGVEQVGMNATAIIFGMPDKIQEFNLTYMKTLATDKNLTLTVLDTQAGSSTTLSSLTALNITTTAIDAGTNATPYTFTFAVEGGNSPYVWSTASTLPTGVTLSTAGVLSGTPTETGTFSLTVVVTDQFGVTDSLTADFVVS